MTAARITATAAVTALGDGVDALWQGLRLGACAIAAPASDDGAPHPVARVPDEVLEPARGATELRPEERDERAHMLLFAALRQLRQQPAWERVQRQPRGRLAVALGTTQGPIHGWLQDQRRLGRGERPLRAPSLHRLTLALARLADARGPLATPSTACTSGAAALAQGLTWLREERADAVIAGGVDALSPFVLHGFARLRALDTRAARPFDAARAGLSLGEGAGLLLLERDAPHGHLLTGAGHSADANHLTGPDPTGSGVARAVVAALRDAGLEPSHVSYVNAHGTATRFNDLMEAKGLALALGEQRAARMPVSSIKGAIGHSMGAAAALEAILCTLVLTHGEIPPTVGLSRVDPQIALDVVRHTPRTGALRHVVSTSSGFGGINVALTLSHGA